MSTSPRMIDFFDTTNKGRPFGAGLNYAISNLASLPTDFTNDFTMLSLSAGAAQKGGEKCCDGVTLVGIQCIVATKGAGFTKVDFQLQVSNVGGSAAGVWVDQGTATSVTDVGSGVIAIPTHIYKAYKFYRIQATATGGTATVFAVGFGNNA
jgi:hypothetical protein